MDFVFIVSPEGIDFIKKNKRFIYQNVEYSKEESTITLKLPEPDISTINEFMMDIKNKGLLVGTNCNERIVLDSEHINKYPYALKNF